MRPTRIYVHCIHVYPISAPKSASCRSSGRAKRATPRKRITAYIGGNAPRIDVFFTTELLEYFRDDVFFTTEPPRFL